MFLLYEDKEERTVFDITNKIAFRRNESKIICYLTGELFIKRITAISGFEEDKIIFKSEQDCDFIDLFLKGFSIEEINEKIKKEANQTIEKLDKIFPSVKSDDMIGKDNQNLY